MIDYSYVITQVKEVLNTTQEFEDINLSFLHFAFPLIENADLEQLYDCNEQIPAKNIRVSGYFCNIDENYISIYVSYFDQFAKYGQIMQEEKFKDLKYSFENLFKMIDDNSYREINESRLLFDLCDYIVSNKNMEVIVNVVTNYSVPLAYDKDGNFTVGNRTIGLRTYDIKDLLDRINSNINCESTLNLKEKFGRGIPAVLISSNKDVDVYLTAFVGDWLAQLYKEDSSGLLSANVRSYLKRTNKVNREIVETVRDAPHEFVAYNNGLSAIATSISYTGDGIFKTINELSGFLIVNGGQTTATLYECKNDKLDLSQITVPAKLSIIKNSVSTEYLISNISIYSNLQTAIKKSDPPSNSKFYKIFEEISKTVLAKKNLIEYHCYFERTNGQYNTQKRLYTKNIDSFIKLNPEKSKFTKLQLAQAIVSWEQLPEIVCRGQEKNFAYFHSIAKYLNTKIIDETYFKGSYALILIYRKLDQIIKKLKLPYKSNIIAYTIAFLSLRCNKKFDLLKIWNDQHINTDLETLLNGITNDVYNMVTDSPKEYPDIRMWSRKTECWDHVKTIRKQYFFPAFETVWEFLPENTAKVFIENNIKNKNLWYDLEKWIQESGVSFNTSQTNMVHGMPAVIFKDEKGFKKITRKQEAFAKQIFLLAVEQGFKFE